MALGSGLNATNCCAQINLRNPGFICCDNHGLHLETFITARADSRVPRNERLSKLMGKSTLFSSWKMAAKAAVAPRPGQTFCHGLS